MTDTAVEGRGAAVEAAEAAIADGRSLRLVRRDFSLTDAELSDILEKLCPLSTEARIRTIKHDATCLQRLIEKLYEKGLNGDTNAAVACIRAWERKAALLGLDAVQRIDLQVINPPNTRASITGLQKQLTGCGSRARK